MGQISCTSLTLTNIHTFLHTSRNTFVINHKCKSSCTCITCKLPSPYSKRICKSFWNNLQFRRSVTLRTFEYYQVWRNRLGWRGRFPKVQHVQRGSLSLSASEWTIFYMYCSYAELFFIIGYYKINVNKYNK